MRGRISSQEEGSRERENLLPRGGESEITLVLKGRIGYSNSISNMLRITLFIILSKYLYFTKLLKDCITSSVR